MPNNNPFLSLKASIVILLVLSIFTQSMSKGIILLSYYTNKAAYEKYCVNKARPKMHCNGQCQLAKKLKAQDEQDKKDPLKNGSYSEIIMICQAPSFHIEPILYFSSENSFPQPRNSGSPVDWAETCFHPPSTAA